MKKLAAIILIGACILPRVMTFNITVNNNTKIHKDKPSEFDKKWKNGILAQSYHDGEQPGKE